ncbi:MAG TPA: xanthine dehydrogenase family protein subunit M [Bauldia sp.]|nr:xanthine dehydrogenase family protein subunit M [Bauldia sp.]
MYETRYHRPKDIAEAAKIFSGAAEARYLAGGQTLLPTMKQRLAAPTDVIDVRRLSELKGITVSGEAVTIGAATTHAEVHSADAVKKAIPALAQLAGLIGDPAVRHMGTIGGSLANNDPAADYPAAVMALNAAIKTDKRTIAAEDFFQGLFATALEPGELIVSVSFPIPAKAAYAKFDNPASRYAMAGVFVAKLKDGAVRVGVTGAHGDGVFRATEIERALTSSWSPEAVETVTISPEGMLSDIHGSAAYRANLVKVMAKRAVAAAP